MRGTKDQATARGLSPEKFAKKAIKAITGGQAGGRDQRVSGKIGRVSKTVFPFGAVGGDQKSKGNLNCDMPLPED